MDFHVEPDFVHREFEPRYYVRTLDKSDPSYARGNRWQIQFLNEDGRGAANLDFGANDVRALFELLMVSVPEAVVEAAMSGMFDYIDSHGNRYDPISCRRVEGD